MWQVKSAAPWARKVAIRSLLLAGAAALLVPAALAPAASAQISIGVGIGAAPPVCPWGYYNYSPYGCAPSGYYGPGYLQRHLPGCGSMVDWGTTTAGAAIAPTALEEEGTLSGRAGIAHRPAIQSIADAVRMPRAAATTMRFTKMLPEAALMLRQRTAARLMLPRMPRRRITAVLTVASLMVGGNTTRKTEACSVSNGSGGA